MNHIQVEIYILIMLECRLPLEEASKIFRIPKDVLDEEIRMKAPREVYRQPLEYLQRECASYPEGLAKAKLKAGLYLRQLQRILKVQDKTERTRLLNEFITTLAGPYITFAINKDRGYTEEEKQTIIKYRLKYAVSTKRMIENYRMDKGTLVKWENELPEGEMKTRCHILREYLADIDTFSKKQRNSNFARSRRINKENE